MERVRDVRKLAFFDFFKCLTEDEDIYKISHQNCDVGKCFNCSFFEELKFDHLFDDNQNFSDNGIYYKFKREKNIKYCSKKNNMILFNNDFMILLSSLYLHNIFEENEKEVNVELRPEIVYFYQCNYNLNILCEVCDNLQENLNFRDITEDLFNMYVLTSPNKFLHGNPDISFLSFNSLRELRIIPSENSSFKYDDRFFMKNYSSKPEMTIFEDDDTFQVKNLDIDYSKYSSEYYNYLWVIEFYCWMVSLFKCEKTYSRTWLDFFRKLWQPQEYVCMINDLSSVKNNFKEIFKFVCRWKLRKNIDDIVPTK